MPTAPELFLCGPERQPCFHFLGSCGAGLFGKFVPEIGGGFIVGGFLGCFQALGGHVQIHGGFGDVRLGFGQRGRKPFTFPYGATQDGVQVSQPFGHGRQPGIGFVQLLQRSVCPVPGFSLPRLRCRQAETVALQTGGNVLEPGNGVVDGGLDLDQRRHGR